jgi:hypothetical protein
MSQEYSRFPEQMLSPELSSGESILWSGQPRGGIQFHAYDVVLIPFSLMWGGFAFFWEGMVLSAYFNRFIFATNTYHSSSQHVPIIFPLWGIPFVLVGLYMIFGRFIVDALIRKHTFYAVTNRRILIAKRWFYSNTQSLNLQQLPTITLSTKADGSGTIVFGSTGPIFSIGRQYTMPPSFDKIDDARKAHDIILGAQQQVGR